MYISVHSSLETLQTLYSNGRSTYCNYLPHEIYVHVHVFSPKILLLLHVVYMYMQLIKSVTWKIVI